MLNSLHLEAFLSVAKHLNFTRAAEAVHITQSALSQRIINLESDLGTSLFIRDRAGIRLTETALDLVRYCQLKNQHEDEFVAGLTSKGAELSGVIRAGGFSSVMRSVFLPRVAKILEQHRRVRLNMLIRQLRELPDLLKRGEIDYMLSSEKPGRDEIEAILLGHEENVLVEKRGYRGPDIYLDHEENDDVTFEYFKKFEKKLKNPKRLFLDDVYGLIDAVKLGLGRAVVPVHMIENEKGLEIISPSQVLKIPVYLCFYKQPFYTKLHDGAVAVLKESNNLKK